MDISELSAWERAHVKATESVKKLSDLIAYLHSKLDSRGSNQVQKMTVKSMKISYDNLMVAI